MPSPCAALMDALTERVLDAVTRAARTPPLGGPEWDAYLDRMGSPVPTPAERAALQRQSMANLRGALPVELRQVLVALKRQTERELRALPRDADDVAREALEAELASFVDRELRAYLDRCRPTATVASIFANARRSTQVSEPVKDGMKALRCKVCGAARPEGSNLEVCAFCGTELFVKERAF